MKKKKSRKSQDKISKVATDGSEQRQKPWDWAIFNATVFVAAACIMAVEILSTRLAARFLGSSLYTWTSAIGVVLAGISLGNYLGGRFADRFHPRRTLSLLFILASLSCVTIPMVNSWIGTWGVLDGLSWPTHIFLHFVLTFLIPATMLGTMSPVVAKMALGMGLRTGRTIGTIYAWGAIGSIVGTFVAGFFLVAWMGTERAILLVAVVLALAGLFYGHRSWVPYAWTTICLGTMICVLGPWSWSQPIASVLGVRDPDAELFVFEEDSQYQRVVVKKTSSNTRTMVLDKLAHSYVNLADPLDLQYEYEAMYAEVMRQCHPDKEPLTAMMIGGGGYVFPRYLEIAYPGSYIEVSEIDPVVTRAAIEAFGLPKDSSIHRYDLDGRNRVADLIRQKRAGDTVPIFDFIFCDAFSDYSVPFHLTTLEFNSFLAELMSDRGVYMLNMIDTYASGRFLGSVVNTCRQVFPHVYVFATQNLLSARNTFIVVNAKRPLNLDGVLDPLRSRLGLSGDMLGQEQLAHLEKVNGDMVLTDDYAPVENMLAEVVKTYTIISSDEEVLRTEMMSAFKEDDYDQVIRRGREMLRRNPKALRMHFLLGSTLMKQGKLNQAIREFRAELTIDPSFVTAYSVIGRTLESLGNIDAAVQEYRSALSVDPLDGPARCNLGRLLAKQGKQEVALSVYREAVRLRPGYVRFHVELGNLLNKKGDAKAALTALEEALKLDPDYPGLRHDLAVVLLKSGKPGEAAIQLQRVLLDEPDNAGLHNQLGRAMAATGNKVVAADEFSRAIYLEPSNASYRANLGLAYEELGRPAEAIAQYRECLKIESRNPPVLNALAKLLSTSSDATVRDGAEAVRWAERLRDMIGPRHPARPEALDTLAAAYAEAERFREALDTARQAIESANANKLRDLASEIRKRLALYQAGRAYHVAR